MQQMLTFAGEIVDQQTFLDGTREFMIEARSAPPSGETAPWLLTLSFRWVAEIDAAVEEGDLSLTGPDGGGIYAAVIEGSAENIFDEDSAEDVTMIRLTAEVRSGEGVYADWSGTIDIAGRLTGGQAHLEAMTDITAPG
jgi:hypothetical protein